MPLRQWEEEQVDLEVVWQAVQGDLEGAVTANRAFRAAAEELEQRDRGMVVVMALPDQTVAAAVVARLRQAQ